ncbi:MAG: GLUG motif-containing protein [Anaerohalosphaeraceae bacterium]
MNTHFNKSILAILFCLGILFSPLTLAAEYGGGKGTAGEPYEIWTPEQMNTIGLNPADWGKHFKLMADIDMSIYTGTQYNIIGNLTTQFTGTFDGGGHVISNLTITAVSQDYVGLFGYVENGQIRNLGINNMNITGDDNVGGLVGFCAFGTITNSYTSGIFSGSNYVSGLLGYNYYSTIRSCYTAGTISGSQRVAGLVGLNQSGTITFCYATGSVDGLREVGGLVGYNFYGTIRSCYSTGTISGSWNVGCLVGLNESGTLTSCFWDIQTSTLTDGVGNEDPDPSGVMGKTTAQMKSLSTFPPAEWDFINVWGIIPNQTYPYLRTDWIADLNHDGKVDLADFEIFASQWLRQ